MEQKYVDKNSNRIDRQAGHVIFLGDANMIIHKTDL